MRRNYGSSSNCFGDDRRFKVVGHAARVLIRWARGPRALRGLTRRKSPRREPGRRRSAPRRRPGPRRPTARRGTSGSARRGGRPGRPAGRRRPTTPRPPCRASGARRRRRARSEPAHVRMEPAEGRGGDGRDRAESGAELDRRPRPPLAQPHRPGLAGRGHHQQCDGKVDNDDVKFPQPGQQPQRKRPRRGASSSRGTAGSSVGAASPDGAPSAIQSRIAPFSAALSGLTGPSSGGILSSSTPPQARLVRLRRHDQLRVLGHSFQVGDVAEFPFRPAQAGAVTWGTAGGQHRAHAGRRVRGSRAPGRRNHAVSSVRGMARLVMAVCYLVGQGGPRNERPAVSLMVLPPACHCGYNTRRAGSGQLLWDPYDLWDLWVP